MRQVTVPFENIFFTPFLTQKKFKKLRNSGGTNQNPNMSGHCLEAVYV
jgi:hypothetical protein